MSETQTKAWALTERGPSSSHVQPEELKGRSRPRLLLAPGLPLGFGTAPVLLDYRGLKRTGEGEGGCFFLRKGLRRGTAHCYVQRGEAGPSSRALGKRSGTPAPKTQPLGSRVCFAPFSDAHKSP